MPLMSEKYLKGQIKDNTANNSELLKLGWKPKVDVMEYVKFQRSGTADRSSSETEINQFDALGPEAVLQAQPDHERNKRYDVETLNSEDIGGWRGDLVKNKP